MKLNSKCNTQLIQAYAPMSASTDEEHEKFLEDLTTAKSAEKTRFTIMTGDFNSKIGQKTQTDPPYIGIFGLGEQNQRGQEMMNFLSKEKINCMNTFFKKHPKKKWTWKSPDNSTKNEIDYVLVTDKRICVDVSILNRFDTDSDHRLVRTKIQVDTRLERKRLMEKKIRPTMAELKGKEEEDSPRDLNKAVQKAIRRDHRAYNTQQINEAIADNFNMKVLRFNMSKGKLVIHRMKNEGDEVVTDKGQVAAVIEDFYRGLYSPVQQYQRAEPRRSVQNVGSEELQQIDGPELREALRQTKNCKAPGEDLVTSEMLKAGGEILEKALLILLNKCLDEGKIPDS
ncbi:craniofacial development protein 2-like [Polyergus mexicanus]|uniref:craniofacial development protein 2-like n=1 Tax=Polyergus mexicanus TaxID=615972 RepID=UPI0038B5D817